MRPVITVLQDHTAFMQHMYRSALADLESLPLNLAAVQAIQAKLLGVKEGKTWVPSEVLLNRARLPGAASRKAALKVAEAVEGEIEAWYCIADDDGAKWLTSNHVGPVLKWGKALWWVKVKGVHIEAEIRFYRPESGPGIRPGGTDAG